MKKKSLDIDKKKDETGSVNEFLKLMGGIAFIVVGILAAITVLDEEKKITTPIQSRVKIGSCIQGKENRLWRITKQDETGSGGCRMANDPSKVVDKKTGCDAMNFWVNRGSSVQTVACKGYFE